MVTVDSIYVCSFFRECSHRALRAISKAQEYVSHNYRHGESAVAQVPDDGIRMVRMLDLVALRVIHEQFVGRFRCHQAIDPGSRHQAHRARGHRCHSKGGDRPNGTPQKYTLLPAGGTEQMLELLQKVAPTKLDGQPHRRCDTYTS